MDIKMWKLMPNINGFSVDTDATLYDRTVVLTKAWFQIACRLLLRTHPCYSHSRMIIHWLCLSLSHRNDATPFVFVVILRKQIIRQIDELINLLAPIINEWVRHCIRFHISQSIIWRSSNEFVNALHWANGVWGLLVPLFDESNTKYPSIHIYVPFSIFCNMIHTEHSKRFPSWHILIGLNFTISFSSVVVRLSCGVERGYVCGWGRLIGVVDPEEIYVCHCILYPLFCIDIEFISFHSSFPFRFCNGTEDIYIYTEK